MTNRLELNNWISKNPEIEAVFAAACDLNGTLRGKRVPVDQLVEVVAGKMRLPLALPGVDVWGDYIRNSEMVLESGDADGICEVTGRGILPITWSSTPSAMIPLWLSQENGAPHLGDPRRSLAEIVKRFADKRLTPVVATELEFYLVDTEGDRPTPPKSPVTGKKLASDNVLSLSELEQFDRFLSDVYNACALQGVPADSAISENGAGQFEINMMHVDDPLRAADDAVLFKRIVRGVARRHGFAATFMAKPYGGREGNGFHVHFSLCDENGENVFDHGGEKGSEILRHAVAGLLATMVENTLVFAPHENSYRRLAPGTHAPSTVAWGYENRSAAIRIPGGSHKARRIEHRTAGADANPYLVLTAVLGGALLGIENQWQPSDPVEGDANAKGLPSLPMDWATAIDAFENGNHVSGIFPDLLRRMLVDCKRQEQRIFKQQVTDFEYQTYLEVV